MSDVEIDDVDKRRFDWDGSERFSDRCNNCNHSRADHMAGLLIRGVARPLGAKDCSVKIRDDKPEMLAIAKADRPMLLCPCPGWEN